MSKIILQPSGNKDAREHYVDTIINTVELSKIKDFISPQEFQILLEIYPKGFCCVWGVTPSGNNITKWNKIQRGDVTLFSKEGSIFASGVTTHKLHSKSLASFLWDYNKDGETWEYVYFLEEIRALKIPYIEFNKAVGYADNYVIQGFNVLTEDQSNLVFQKFDLESEVFIQEITEANFDNLIKQLESLEDTERKISSSRRLEQGYLKNYLFGRKTNGKCACCNKTYPVSYLVTAHIKKRAFCNSSEKRDLNIVMPMCKFGCDDLYEKGYLSVQSGKFISLINSPTSDDLENQIKDLIGNDCTYYNLKTEEYFNWHYNHYTNK